MQFFFAAVDLKVPNPRSHPIIHPRHTNGRLFCQYKSTDLSQRLDSSLKVKLWFTIDRVVEGETRRISIDADVDPRNHLSLSYDLLTLLSSSLRFFFF